MGQEKKMSNIIETQSVPAGSDLFSEVIEGLEPATLCKFRVASKNSKGMGPYSTELVTQLPSDSE